VHEPFTRIRENFVEAHVVYSEELKNDWVYSHSGYDNLENMM
jgi:hypothetical protein